MSDLSTKELHTAVAAGFARLAEILSEVDKKHKANIGTLSSLTTQEKTNLVAALNEVKASLDAFNQIDDTSAKTNKAYSSHKVDALIAQAITNLLNGADESSDTLKELADKIAAQIEAMQGVLSVSGAQNLEDEQKRHGRNNLGLGALATVDTQIDDGAAAADKAWSSQKTQTEITNAIDSLRAENIKTTTDFAAQINTIWEQLNRDS